MTTVPELDPIDLLVLAQELNSRDDSPSIRSACDRAYYAAYLYTRNELTSLGRVELDGRSGDHGKVISSLKAQPDGLRHGNDLSILRRTRNSYTYDTGSLTLATTGGSARPTSWVLSRAQAVINFVQQLS